MSRFMYGVEYLREYDSSNADHEKRRKEGRVCELPSGPKLLLDAFDCILARVSTLTSNIVLLAHINDITGNQS